MFNTVILSGRLTSDPELKQTNSGLNVVSFSIANETGYGDNKKTHFIPIVAWRSTAELISKYFSKGSLIGIEGQIQMRKYEDKDGKNHNAFEVVANQIQFLESKKTQSQEQEQNHIPPTDTDGFMSIPDGVEDEGLPFN